MWKFFAIFKNVTKSCEIFEYSVSSEKVCVKYCPKIPFSYLHNLAINLSSLENHWCSGAYNHIMDSLHFYAALSAFERGILEDI